MHHRTLLGGVDRRARKHGVPMRLHAALAGQIEQQLLRGAVNQDLGQIGKDVGGGLAKGLKAASFCRKVNAHVISVATAIESDLECTPSGGTVTASSDHGRVLKSLGANHQIDSKNQAADSNFSSFTASTQKARMPSANFSVAMASSLKSNRKTASLS